MPCPNHHKVGEPGMSGIDYGSIMAQEHEKFLLNLRQQPPRLHGDLEVHRVLCPSLNQGTLGGLGRSAGLQVLWQLDHYKYRELRALSLASAMLEARRLAQALGMDPNLVDGCAICCAESHRS